MARLDESLNTAILDRLVRGKPLDGLPLDTKDGRLDLGGLTLLEPRQKQTLEFRDVPVTQTEPVATFKGAKWRNLDFSGSKLACVRFFEAELINCRFDRCQLKDFRVWATTFRGCSFRAANLRNAVLGGVLDGKRTIYSNVDFSGADLRETVYKAAAFETCIFRNSRLQRVDFQSSTFTDCVFEGELRDVLFYERGFEGESFPKNEMLDVDFARANLHDVGFRGLTLDRVKLPDDAEHIIIKDVPKTLDRLIRLLSVQADTTAKKLVAFLNIDREWRASNQAQTVINTEDLAETVGPEGVDRLRYLLSRKEIVQ
jgi:fluoroquinolone resistance protein